MKRRGWLFGSIISVICLLNTALAETTVGRITHYSGDVKIIMPSGKVLEAKRQLELRPGTAVNTGDLGHAVLTFEDGHSITLQSHTTFVIQAYRFDRLQMHNSSIVISLLKGGIRSITGLIGDMNRAGFKLNTPVATIGIRGTDFHAALHDPERLYTLIYSGAISIENAAGAVIVAADQAAVVPSRLEPPRLIAPSTLPKRIFDDIGRVPSSSRSTQMVRTNSLDRPGRWDKSARPDRPERPNRREGRSERPEMPGLLRRGSS